MATSSFSLEGARKFGIETAVAAGRETLRFFRQNVDVQNKRSGDGFDPVTAADQACERAIRKCIRSQYPTHGILGEEFGESEASEWTWVIDPIDGTRAFISGFTHWGVLLGLMRRKEPVLGVMHQPYLRETFVGDGQSTQLIQERNFSQLNTSDVLELSDARFATTDPRLFKDPFEIRFRDRIESRARLTRYGNDCYQYVMLAQGNIDVVIENRLKPWDICPLAPIVRGAGGKLTNWEGQDDLSSGNVIAVANHQLLDEVLQILQEEGLR